jgi:hypothetical protein
VLSAEALAGGVIVIASDADADAEDETARTARTEVVATERRRLTAGVGSSAVAGEG